jgi:hypothetical protein
MELKIAFTDKEITPWGGMVLLKNMLDQIGLGEVVNSCSDLPGPGSNRGYCSLTIIEAFLVSVWCGANRFLHTEVTRHDRALTQIFGWERAPGNDTYKRYFAKFTQRMNQNVFEHFYQWFFSQLRFDRFTLDFDSSILTRYGQQEGAVKGYNPHKPGRASHHPLMAFVADSWMVANFWLRRGDAHAANNFVSFLEDTLTKLQDKQVGLVRLDSGFYDQEVFNALEKRDLSYIVAARFYWPIQRAISRQRTWLKLDEGVEVAETMYQSPGWKKARRMIMVRQQIDQHPHCTGKTLRLFSDEGIYQKYRYSCYITNLTLSAADVWRLYRQRATSENRIKELKYDFGLSSFNIQNFFGTEAALNFVMLAYNLMSLFRQFILNSRTQHTLSTLRYKTFAIGAYLVKEGNTTVLKLSLVLKRREWFSGLWLKSKQFKLPVQFSNA